MRERQDEDAIRQRAQFGSQILGGPCFSFFFCVPLLFGWLRLWVSLLHVSPFSNQITLCECVPTMSTELTVAWPWLVCSTNWQNVQAGQTPVQSLRSGPLFRPLLPTYHLHCTAMHCTTHCGYSVHCIRCAFVVLASGSDLRRSEKIVNYSGLDSSEMRPALITHCPHPCHFFRSLAFCPFFLFLLYPVCVCVHWIEQYWAERRPKCACNCQQLAIQLHPVFMQTFASSTEFHAHWTWNLDLHLAS